jgi:foldase protein PrsA
MMGRVPTVLALFLLGACAPSGISHVPPPSMASPAAVVDRTACAPVERPTDRLLGAGAEGAVLAKVGGREITAEDVAREFFRTHRPEAFAALNKLVIREIVEREAGRIGLSVPESFVAEERKRALKDLETQAFKTYGAGTTPARFLEIELKQSLDNYLRQKDADAKERYLLARVIRFHAIQSDRVELQLVTLDDEKSAREVAQKLDQGADFAQLAMTYSKHPSGRSGGRMPPMARESLNPAVADRAFALAPGERTSILSVDDGLGRRQFEIVKVLRRLPGRLVTWPEVAAEVEEGLKSEPLTRDEFIAWNLRLERLYSVWVDPNL